MSISATAVEITPNVTRFLSKPKKMLIGGEWVTSASGKTFPVYDPATGREIAQVSEGEEEDINRAVKAARKAFESGPWPKMSPADRTRLLWKLADLLEENKEEFAQLETLDNGKPITYSRAVDVALSTAVLRYHAGWATKIEGHTIPISLPGGPYHAYTT
ncbi:MAG: aldehyde dehydrogenase family protein, partial [Gammaproteobacteria bacterium]